MKEKIEMPIEKLNELFSYDPESGLLVNKVSRWVAKKGDEAGCLETTGYRAVRVFGRRFRVHRVVFAMHHGFWPRVEVDHINCIKSDNRISNLRLATPEENSRNSFARSSNTSGFKGVTWDKRKCKWQAQIGSRGKTHFLGLYAAAEDAAEAYSMASERLHGEFGKAELKANTKVAS